MGVVLFVYIVLMIGFLIMAALIFRYTKKYGYLSPKFRVIVSIFGLIALGIIIFSLYLMFQLFAGGGGSTPTFTTPSSSGIQF